MGVHRLRHKLVLVFLAATLLPLGATLWMSSALMQRSLTFVPTGDADRLAASLEHVAREFYGQAREQLKTEAAAGRVEPQRFAKASRSTWPTWVTQFSESPDAERFVLSEPAGDRLHYLQRRGAEIWLYTRSLEGVRLGEVARELQQARSHAGDLQQRDLARGFTVALALAGAVIWLLSLGVVVYMANRISRPIDNLTDGLHQLAAGAFETRLVPAHDEVGRAVLAFNHTASQLQQNRERLVYLTQVASWQLLARKMAHELKNSLTPIRLTVEEILARQPAPDRAFLEQAAQIVADEVGSLERRVRAFSEFAAEPPVNPTTLDLDRMLDERIQFLQVAHPDVAYRAEAGPGLPAAWADADQVKGILTNLFENAAEAAGAGGTVLGVTGTREGQVLVEVHDSGPGISSEARNTLFEPSISFKKRGMGLGLAISRRHALLSGGDLQVTEGRLGGAAFRLLLPVAAGGVTSPGGTGAGREDSGVRSRLDPEGAGR
jgi:nitrogen fixation/metabolism regulation signal transduction histidine kinase